MKKLIPNAITAGNLFFGCLAVIATFDDNLTQAALYILVAAVFDFFDGFAARLLKVSSEIGKQLDSLADMVSFGVAPGFIFYSLSQDYLTFNEHFFQFVPLLVFISYAPLLMPVFSAVRLAKFNLDTRQTDSFIGVPTPANAMFIGSIPFVLAHGPAAAYSIFTSSWFIILYPVVVSYLMIAELPLLAFKFKNFRWAGNEMRYVFIAGSVVLLVCFKYFGISLCIVLYILLSVVNNFIRNKNEIQSRN